MTKIKARISTTEAVRQDRVGHSFKIVYVEKKDSLYYFALIPSYHYAH